MDMLELAARDNRIVTHMDLDTFFVSVERLKNPKLNGLPVVVGGSSDRAVVASCSYEARKYGIHSAMPVKMARQLCPDAVFVRGDMDEYSRYSRLVTDIIAEAAPIYEKRSIDEFYLDLTGMDRFYDAYRWACELRQRIVRETGLPISMGYSVNKTVAKIATGEAKPAGYLRVERGSERPFLAPLPVQRIPGVGQKMQNTLYELGIRRIATLQQMPARLIEHTFGANGLDVWKKAHGIDPSPVEPYSEAKSMGSEQTFERDTIDHQAVKRLLAGMTEELAQQLRNRKRMTGCVTVKVRYSTFETVSRQQIIGYTQADHKLIPVVHSLFDRLYDRRLRIRLVGVKFSKLIHGVCQLDLFDEQEEHLQRLYSALDRLNARWGTRVVGRTNSVLGVRL
ncbi:DNA polymerase IV [Thermaurantimonas aggregans]|uniref:DNA polymerase IV n=1 Tax=Thermaurantimonas aggregans TaxID=2173829 RepID=A0A401XM49_9FLAO|nr:DNA polymerase IV [Thermaurantimonas aggregans]MCX8147956.1 DNA polymerase IV [Thermaurantimonas aggregans]GCD78087.1 DNA polymerase IV [Thermaurantimonas aggregans]